uniref:Uncharacterized protein n=1 Tax=Physcomitrium patens TaxID=3218 RepID=A0A2K1J818_PHYPA|nr:hypothetical protein PHYPA_020766 [Physcomitrium patens]
MMKCMSELMEKLPWMVCRVKYSFGFRCVFSAGGGLCRSGDLSGLDTYESGAFGPCTVSTQVPRSGWCSGERLKLRRQWKLQRPNLQARLGVLRVPVRYFVRTWEVGRAVQPAVLSRQNCRGSTGCCAKACGDCPFDDGDHLLGVSLYHFNRFVRITQRFVREVIHV